jgi:hypothetical protein
LVRVWCNKLWVHRAVLLILISDEQNLSPIMQIALFEIQKCGTCHSENNVKHFKQTMIMGTH